jgi:regulator of protease activity HflC (stomatin/prohibitin superfamily)
MRTKLGKMEFILVGCFMMKALIKFSGTWLTLLHSYGVEDAEYAISQLAQTTMRSEIGKYILIFSPFCYEVQ